MEQYQFFNLSQKQNNTIEYLLEDVNNKNSRFEFLNKFSDEDRKFNVQFRGKTMLAIGSERAYNFIVYLAENKIEKENKIYGSVMEKYREINKIMEDIFFFTVPTSEVLPNVVYKQLYKQEYTVSKLLITLIDRHFFSNTLRTWGWDDRIQVIWGSQDGGVSASTMRYGNHSIIKVNLYAFVSWIGELKNKKGKSLGNNNCNSIIDCIVKTVCHEIVHTFLQMTPCIIDTETNEIIIRSKNVKKHYELSKKYKDTAYVNGFPYFTFGQLDEGPGSTELKGSSGGHQKTFMAILYNWFGQNIPEHNLYTVNYQPYQQLKKLRF